MNQLTFEYDRKPAKRLNRQAQAILDSLRESRLTSDQLNRMCFRYSARIHEIRKYLAESEPGTTIQKRRVKQGDDRLWEYWLDKR